MTQKLAQLAGLLAVVGYLDPWAMTILILGVVLALGVFGAAVYRIARIAIRG